MKWGQVFHVDDEEKQVSCVDGEEGRVFPVDSEVRAGVVHGR